MTFKRMKELFNGKVRTFEGKRVYYMQPYDLFDYVGTDWAKIREWNGICIYPSKENESNKCFYFFWGYGGTPEYIETIKIKEKKNG